MISKVKPVVFDEEKEWFETWFDSPYYHILYQHRDEKEAEDFLDRLIASLKPTANARILDVACGKGRHSLYLHKKGFDVTGFDLSENNINHLRGLEKDNLHFYLHDMREVFRVNYFDVVLNLFSSFGYFDKDRDNERCMIANATSMKKEGVFVFDFFNSSKILKTGNVEETKTISGISFHIHKIIEGNTITKHIKFEDKGKQYAFQEKLMLVDRDYMLKLFEIAGLQCVEQFGNYQLGSYDQENSDRLILIAKKVN